MKRTKNVDKWAFLNAMQIYNEYNFVSVDDETIVDLIQDNNDPEKILLEKEKHAIIEQRKRELSLEAQEIIDMIFNSPAELFKLFGSEKKGHVNRFNMEKKMAKQWGDKRKAHMVIRELMEFAKIAC